jgi:hypothetical protein
MDATLVPLFKLKLDMAVASYTKKENPVGEVEDFFDGLRQYLHLSGAAGCVKMENIVVGWPIHHKTCRNTFFCILFLNRYFCTAQCFIYNCTIIFYYTATEVTHMLCKKYLHTKVIFIMFQLIKALHNERMHINNFFDSVLKSIILN